MTGEAVLVQRRADATAQQDAVIRADARTVIACPGAGKTRTIVERHCGTERGRPSGRAIISFTKVAAAQIRARATTLGRPDLLEHPHAITTLDGFFWRFLVRPFLPAPADSNGGAFRRLESWRDAPRKLRLFDYWKEGAARPIAFDLAEFQFRYAGGRAAPTAALTGLARKEGPRRHLTDDEIAVVCRLAGDRRTDLANNHHLLTGEETRRLAHQSLQDHRDLLARTLTARFQEIVVDEAQDCSDVDVDLLLAVEELGLPMMVVGDPDQAIYGFRAIGSTSAGRLLGRTPILQLTGNWRSGEPICSLAATLRAIPHRPADVVLTTRPDGDLPVHLLPADGTEVITFGRLADEAGIAPPERLILAHAAATLPGAGAQGRRPPSSPTKALAWAVSALRDPLADQKTRDLAGQTLQAAIVRFWMPGADAVAAADRQSEWGIDPYHLRRLAAAALGQLPDLGEPAKQWCASARQVITSLNPANGKAPNGTTIQCPAGDGQKPASSLAGRGARPGGAVAYRADTVHGVKGEEADAVLMILPGDERTDRLVTRWIGGSPTGDPEIEEALRVLYVAVTRARHLVALALAQRHLSAVGALLQSRDVPVVF